MHPCLISYVSVCEPYHLPPPWDCCPVDLCSLQGPVEPQAVLAQLVAQHGEKAVEESGLTRRSANGQLALHPCLAASAVGIILLRDSSTGGFRDLLTPTGCIFTERLPLFEVLTDQHTHRVLCGPQRQVWLTEHFADIVLLRSLGLAAAPLVGLAGASANQMEMLGQFYGVTRTLSLRELEEASEAALDPDAADDETPTQELDPDNLLNLLPGRQRSTSTMPLPPGGDPTFIFAGSNHGGNKEEDHVPLGLVMWSLHSLSLAESPQARRAIDSLTELQTHRGLEIDHIDLWAPRESDLATLQFALARRESEWIKAALLDSLHMGLRSLDVVMPAVIKPPLDMAAALDQLQEALLDPAKDNSRNRRREALVSYLRAAGRQLGGPILRRAQATLDPLERSLWMQFAELNTIFLSRSPIAREQLLQGFAPGGSESSTPNKSVPELLAVSRQLVTLAKEIRKCRHATDRPLFQSTPKWNATPPLDLSQRFASLDLAKQN